MDVMLITKETLQMMGFTFIIGIAFAYVLKALTLLFSGFNGRDLSSLIKRGKVWRRAYCMDAAHIYRDIKCISWTEDGRLRGLPLVAGAGAETIYAMDGLAEYHFGNVGEKARRDTEMKQLYEFHYGKI